eukprot:1480320-Pyramimonas_sp.AAC.1
MASGAWPGECQARTGCCGLRGIDGELGLLHLLLCSRGEMKVMHSTSAILMSKMSSSMRASTSRASMFGRVQGPGLPVYRRFQEGLDFHGPANFRRACISRAWIFGRAWASNGPAVDFRRAWASKGLVLKGLDFQEGLDVMALGPVDFRTA